VKIGQRNFGFSLVGGVQQFITNCARPAEFGLPAASEPLLPWHKLSEAFEDGEPNLLQALRWDYGLVETLYGREQDEKAIVDWANGGTRAASVRLVTGAGGAGKTRLGAAVARKLKDEGWTAGFLPQSEAALFEVGEKGLFLILDYPEEQAARTKALFQKLAEWHDAPYPIRLLLLSRRPFGEWEPDALVLGGRFGRHARPARCPPRRRKRCSERRRRTSRAVPAGRSLTFRMPPAGSPSPTCTGCRSSPAPPPCTRCSSRTRPSVSMPPSSCAISPSENGGASARRRRLVASERSGWSGSWPSAS
jgi:hypothetical protein